MNKKWTLLEQGSFLRKMGELLDRGYSYSEAVESLLYQMPEKRHKELKSSLEELKAGQPLYIILANLKFQKDLIGYIYFADKHGGMLEAISEGSKMTLSKDTNVKKIKKAILYPLFLLCLTNILFVFVDKTLLPQYLSLYNSMGLEVNLFTKIIAGLGKFLPYGAMTVLLLFALLCLLYYFYFLKIPALNQRRFILKIPFIGPIIRLVQTQYFTLQLGYLLSGGLSLHESLLLFKTAPRNEFYRELGKVMTERLKRGEEFPRILCHINLFESELPIVFNHGQTNGKLEKELLFFSQGCLKKLEEKMEKSLKLIQPVLYGVIAILVVSMYLSIMLPMFRMLNGI